MANWAMSIRLSAGCRRSTVLYGLLIQVFVKLPFWGRLLVSRCAASALVREGREAALAHPESLMRALSHNDPARISAKLVIDCARQNDPAALFVFDRYTDALSSAAASLINILDPEVIAFGGGVSGAGEFLFAPVREKTKQKSFYAEHARIVPAVLGNDAGMLGAALLYADDRK